MNTTVLSELKRRKVVRVAGAYLLIAWVVLQVAGALEDALELPETFDGYVVVALAIGFPVVLMIAWVFDLTRSGIQRTSPATDGSPAITRVAVAVLFLVSVLGGAGIAGYWFFTSGGDAPEAAGPSSAFDSIAVLPLTDLSSEGELDHLGLAISDELRNVLSRVQDVRVASRPSSLKYRDEVKPDMKVMTEELGVTHILDGSLQQAGDILRVTVQLNEGASDSQVMSRTFDLPLSVNNILTLQDDIARDVVAALGRDLGQSAQDALRFLAASGTDELAAYDAYLQAREMFINRNQVTNPEQFDAITTKLESATRIDPQFGHAWAALAMQYFTAIAWGSDPQEYSRKAREAAERALALDDHLALAHAVLGMTSTLPDGRADRAAAIDGLTRAIELNPMEATLTSWRGQHWIELGFFERGISDLFKTIELTVNNGVANFWIINARLLMGDLEGARERLPQWSRNDGRLLTLQALALSGNGNTQAIRPFLLGEEATDPVLIEVVDALTLENYDHNAGYVRVLESAEATGDTNLVERPLMLYVFKQYDALPQEPPLSGRLTWWLTGHDDFRNHPKRYEYFHELALSDYWLEREFPARCTRDDSEAGFSCR